MSDAHANSSENEPDEPEIEETEGDEPEAEIEGTEGEAGDEPEAEPEDDGAEPEAEPEQRTARGQPSREHRDRRLSEQQRIDRAVARELERRGISPNRQQQPDYAEQARQLTARRKQEIDAAMLEGGDAAVARVEARHVREDLDARANSFAFQQADERNERQFDRLCARNPVYDAVRDEVDQRISEMRSQGNNGFINREVVAKVILGERYAERASRQGTKQRRAAEGETRRQTVRAPANASGQHAAPRGSRRGARSFSDLSVEEMEAQLSTVPVRSA